MNQQEGLIEFKRLPDESTPAIPEAINHNFKYLDDNEKANSYFKPGDVYQPGYYCCSGFISGASKEIQITIPSPKSMANVQPSLKYLDIVVRGTNGYVITRTQDKTGWTISKNGDHNITLSYINDAALGTNNSPVTATLYTSFKIEFV